MRLLSFIAIAAAGALLSCNSRPSSELEPSAAQPALEAAGRGLPQFGSVKGSSTPTPLTLSGSDATELSAGATVNGGTVELAPSGDGFAYAVYRFNLEGQSPAEVTVEFADPATTAAWVGVGNNATDTWDLAGPYGATATRPIGQPLAYYVNSNGDIWVVVVAHGGETATIVELSIVVGVSDEAWLITPVIGGLNGGRPDMVEYVGGGPAIAWRTTSPNYVHGPSPYVTRFDWTGGALSANHCEEISLAIVAGKPAVAYYSLGDLLYRYAAESNGFGGWTEVTVVEEFDVGDYAALAVVGGKPAIAYWNATTQQVFCAQSSVADGSSGWSTSLVNGDVAWDLDLCEINGEAAICYGTGDGLVYAQGSGAGGWDVEVIDSEAVQPRNISIAAINGEPAVAYQSVGGDDLLFATRTEDNWQVRTIDAENDTGAGAALAVIDGVPAISYLDADEDDLKYAYASTPSGLGGEWTITTVNTNARDSGDTALALIGGKTAICFFEKTNGLSYAILIK
jgi:hypothetical protein